MRRLFAVVVLGLLGAAIAGCEASARVDDDDDDRTYRRTTVHEQDGDVHTRTEIRRED